MLARINRLRAFGEDFRIGAPHIVRFEFICRGDFSELNFLLAQAGNYIRARFGYLLHVHGM